MLYSKIAAVVRYSGGTVALGVGMSIDEDHPLALERPDIFGTEPPGADIRTPAILKGRKASESDAEVERATRAPGEKRTGRSRTSDRPE